MNLDRYIISDADYDYYMLGIGVDENDLKNDDFLERYNHKIDSINAHVFCDDLDEDERWYINAEHERRRKKATSCQIIPIRNFNKDMLSVVNNQGTSCSEKS